MTLIEILFLIIVWFIGAFAIVKAAESFGLIERHYPESKRKIEDDDEYWGDI